MRVEGAAFRFRSAACLRQARRYLRARLQGVRPRWHFGHHQPAQARRQDPADPGSLRPDRKPHPPLPRERGGLERGLWVRGNHVGHVCPITTRGAVY